MFGRKQSGNGVIDTLVGSNSKVNGDLNWLVNETFQTKSSIARAAMNIGPAKLKSSIDTDVLELIEEFAFFESAIVTLEVVK